MKKILSAALATLLTISLLPGCTGRGGSKDGKTELLLGLPGGEGNTNWKIVENFKAANADKYEIKEDISAWNDFNQKIKLQFVAKNNVVPVFVTDSMQAMTFGAQGAVLDLKNWVDTELDTELYSDALFAITDTEGHLWGVPHALNSVAVYYNKEIFDERGVAYPTEDWTWQDMLDMAKALTFDRDGDGTTDVYGINYASNITLGWLPFMAAVGVSPYKNNYRDSNLDDPKVKEAMEKFAQPVQDGLSIPPAELAALGSAPAAFADGKIAMALLQSSSIAAVNKFNADFDWDVQIMPIGWNGERACIYVPNTWQVYAGVSDAEKEGVLEWLSYYLSEEAQMLLATEGPSGFPIMKTALDAITESGRKPEHIDAFYKGIDAHGMTLLENPASASTRTIVDNMASKIKAGEDIDQLIATSHTDMQRELDYFYENQ